MGAFIFWARKVTSRNFLFLRLECSIFGNITKTFFRTYKKALRLGSIRKITQLGGTQSSSLSLLKKYLAIAVKIYAKGDIKWFWSCLILLDFFLFSFCQISCSQKECIIKKQSNFILLSINNLLLIFVKILRK